MANAPRQYDLFDAPPAAPAQPVRSTRPVEPRAAPDACYWDFCPNCGARLHNHGCKYRCPDCHYFMSCSDFD